MSTSKSQSQRFIVVSVKSTYNVIAGAHMGAPLQKLVNPLIIDVGEGPCALPQNNSRDDYLDDQSEKQFLQWNHTI